MPKEAGILFLVMLGMVIFGQMWFRFVEGILEGLKKRLFPSKEPVSWHPLPKEEENKGEIEKD
ncbi:hypothetical protein H9X85_09530 [Anaerotignum lactatifermentans]|uniref:Flagellin Flp1-like domain-containing protein n=1 Tax=Anaerotignum lactatifermentans TaxID=160404 RepID=A0ABS2GC51_9FIRM|nr:hypothetical protein [Anaerotignum lactatifermentans]MBM6830046.1 hypothetical protein [Anaerotignum lactatifermentans]MBM6878290.1 hypothetical protein [Anaerotignum lactatifermentans]MBM6951445.1 hypothetical protein [Anaerotignum lactatifermentans]